MKPIGGKGEPVQSGVFTAEELLRYAMSLPVATTISGASDPHILEQNLTIAQNFTPLSPTEMQSMRDRAKPYAGDGHFELYKTSINIRQSGGSPGSRIPYRYAVGRSETDGVFDDQFWAAIS